jgi:hypothetical protein
LPLTAELKNNEKNYQMENREILSLLAPITSLVFGLFIKYTKNPQFESVKKYSKYIIILGALLIAESLYKFLYS